MRILTLLTVLLLAGLSQANAQDASRLNPEKQPIVRESGPAGCDIAVRPSVVLKPGEKVHLTWALRNANSATIVHDGNLIEVEPGKNSRDETPSRTTTYTMFVTGGEGVATCQVSVAVPERTQPLQWPPALLASMPPDYLERARESLTHGITAAKLVSDYGWTQYAIAALLFGQDVDKVNRYFTHVWPFQSYSVEDFGLFSLGDIRLYGLFNDRTGAFPGRLAKGAQRNIEEEFFKVGARGKARYGADLGNVWKLQASENHSFAAWSSRLLVSQFLKNSPAFATRTFDDGRTPAQHYADWREFWSRVMDERAKRGLYIEVGSPTYEKYSRGALQNIRDFSEDAVLRQKAEMLLDLTYALAAQESLANGVRGGAKSRVRPFRSTAIRGGQDTNYNLIFDPSGSRPLYSMQATSSYFPPPVILRLGKDSVARGSYSMVQRGPGAGSDTTAGATIDPSRSAVRYSFVTPSYILGSFIDDPDQRYVGSHAQHRWQGVVFDGDTGARIAPQITRLDQAGAVDPRQRVPNGFASVQDRNVLITQRSNYQNWDRSRTDVYFSGTLDLLEEEEPWIFTREGDAYAAVRIVDGSYRWLDQTHRNKGPNTDRHFITLANPDSPMIIVAGAASDYGNDFEKFKSTLKSQSVQRDGATTRFAGVTFLGPKRSSVHLDLSKLRTFDSPFVRSDWESGVIYIRRAQDGLLLDFSIPDTPIKDISPALTPSFPSGVGEAHPILFQGR